MTSVDRLASIIPNAMTATKVWFGSNGQGIAYAKEIAQLRIATA